MTYVCPKCSALLELPSWLHVGHAMDCHAGHECEQKDTHVVSFNLEAYQQEELARLERMA